MVRGKGRVRSLLLGFAALMCLPAAAEEPPAPNLEDDVLIDGLPASLQPWRDPSDPKIMRLDDNWDFYYKRRDRGADPKRDPGPINMQRYEVVSGINGFPTYMGLPVALTPQDLVAGKVDVCLCGSA